MNYTDVLFIVGFCLVCLISISLRSVPRVRAAFLVCVSLLVLASWGIVDLSIFLFAAAINYVAAGIVDRLEGRWKLRFLLGVITFDISMLAVTKFSPGILDVAAAWFNPNVTLLSGIPPIAISFYTFHIISYLVDVYRGQTSPKGPLSYLFYLSFFPHMIAGPIVRSWQLMPQVGRIRVFPGDLAMGVHFVVVGFFLKVVCADNIGGQIDPWWGAFQTSSAADRWLLAFLYYCQIYADFAGYSLMALGMARLLGYRLPANFRSPLLANGLQEFWRRWHITLSRWLRDYLYIPLGGSRSGSNRTAINLMITMVLGGIWHGTGITFVLWGAMHGIGLVTERWVRNARGHLFASGAIGWLVTQLWITIAWVPFRIVDAADAMSFMAGMFNPANLRISPGLSGTLLFAIPVVLHQVFPLGLWRIGRKKLPSLLGVITGVLLLTDVIVAAPSRVFIYFKF
jgi:alginate O-acetyltransferase complex protein AlgI